MECHSPSHSSEMKMKSILPSLILLGAVIASCGGISDPNQIVFPADSVSYSKQVEPYLALACEATGCHNALDQAGGVDLSSWIGIRSGSVPVVVPKDTTSSLLYKVLYGEQVHYATIIANANDRKGIATWIMEGAQNN